MLSQTSQYALRTVVHLARLPKGDRGSAGELARAVGIPSNYLSKTLNQLARAGVVTGTRGKHGGFELARAPHRITLAEVVAPFQDVGERTCLLGRPACTDARPCPAHGHWKTVAQRVADFFAGTTIADLLDAPDLKKTSRRSHGELSAAR
jgi:Rrf2 family protein